MWGYPLWSFAPLALLMWLKPVADTQALRRFAVAFIAVFVAFPIIYVATEIGEPLARDRPKATQFPGRALAEIVTRDWHNRYGTPVTYVGGSEFVANNVAVYSLDRPHVVVHGELRLSPWVDVGDLRRRGAVLGSGLIAEDDGCCDCDGAHEGVGATVVSGRDPSPVLEPAEHALDAIALFVSLLIVFDWFISAGPAGNAGFDAETCQGFTEPIAVIALVGDEHVGVRQARQHGRGTAIVADLAFGKQQDQRFAVGVANRMQLGVQAALCPPDTTGNTPFLNKLAAVRWAFRCVASIMTAPVASLMAASVAKIRLKTPALLQRMKRL